MLLNEFERVLSVRLFIKQKVFSIGDRFTVKDEMGNDRYYVQGEVFSFGHRLHVYDLNGAEAAYIQQKVFAFMPRYTVFINGAETAQLVKQFTFLRQSYRLEGLPWVLEGNFLAHDYCLSENGRVLMNMSKEWFAWGDSYALDIADGVSELLCLCIVLAVDCVDDSQNN